MNRHNRFTPQWVFLLCGTLLVFIALFLVLPVAISAEDAEPETVDTQSGAGWIYPEPVLARIPYSLQVRSLTISRHYAAIRILSYTVFSPLLSA